MVILLGQTPKDAFPFAKKLVMHLAVPQCIDLP
jgi:hypothetical protein